MKRHPKLTMKLKVCDPELKLYIIALEKENKKLHMQIAKLQSDNVSYQNEITALKKFKPKPETTTVVVNRYGVHKDLPPSK